MDTVILLEHLRVDSDGNDHLKTIGIYRQKSDADAAVGRLKDKPGFRGAPRIIDPSVEDVVSGFYLSKYTLDSDHWVEGFGFDEDVVAAEIATTNTKPKAKKK